MIFSRKPAKKDKTTDIICQMKTDIKKVQKEWGFIGSKTENGLTYGETVGGPVSVKFIEIQEKVLEIQLKKDRSGDHYCYPFVPNGYGYVEVPVTAKNGTMVFTPGMNGCALSVFKCGDALKFCHDADGKHLADRRDHIVRVTYNDYAGKPHFDEGSKFTMEGKGYFCHTIICILYNNKWHVLNCGVKVHAVTNVVEIFHHPLFGLTQDVIKTFEAR